MLRNIQYIFANGQNLTIKLHEKDYQFFKILSKINFSPESGLFFVHTKCPNEIILLPNKHHRLYNSTIPKLSFGLYNSGCTYDISYNTSLSNSFIKQNLSKIHVASSFIHIALTFINPKFLAPEMKSFRIILFDSIDKEVIANKFYALQATSDFYITDTYNSKRKLKHICANSHKNISIGYDSFYPNKQILNFIKQQLTLAGFNVTLKKDDYFNPKYDYDMKLMLLYPDYVDDMAFYKSIYFYTLLHLSVGGKYDNLLKKLQRKHIKHSYLNKLNNIMLDQAIILPLFKLNSIHTSKDSIFNFSTLNYHDLTNH